MNRRRTWALLGGLALTCLAEPGQAAEARRPGELFTFSDRAALNYQLHCSGCHKDDGSGQPGFVPALKGQMGRYLQTDEGRAFLIRVPGVSQSLLADRELADVMNFVVRTFDPDGAPAQARPFDAAEIGRLRKAPLSDTESVRRRLMAASGPKTDRE